MTQLFYYFGLFILNLFWFFVLILNPSLPGAVLIAGANLLVIWMKLENKSSTQFWSYISLNKLKLIVRSSLVIILVFLAHHFRSAHHLEYLFLSDEADTLLVKSNDEWTPVPKAGLIDRDTMFTNEKVTIYSLEFQRSNDGILHRLENAVNANVVHVFEFDPSCKFGLVHDENRNLNAKEAVELSGAQFCLNANLYQTACEITHVNLPLYGLKVNNDWINLPIKPKNSGLFVDNNGHVSISKGSEKSAYNSTSIVSECKPYAIRNGKIDDALHAKRKDKFCRNLVGKTKSGKVVFMVSGTGGWLTFTEMATLGQQIGMQEALFFDGGAALQYQFKTQDFELDFAGFNNTIDFFHLFDKNMINGKLAQRSPVYFSVKF